MKKIEKSKAEIECEYETEIVYNCPVNGTTTQILKVKRYKSAIIPEPITR